jgi:mono/diheme cytochrome c family protein
MTKSMTVRTLACLVVALSSSQTGAQSASSGATIERGRYMVLTGHCNNCHTAGYAATSGKIPESKWLMGNPVGWRGKQGTTYGDEPAPLRAEHVRGRVDPGRAQRRAARADAVVEPARNQR